MAQPRGARPGAGPVMLLYSLLLSTGLLVSSPWWAARMVTTRRYWDGLPERLGRVPARIRAAVAGRQIVWLHAVSVGEVLAATRLVAELEAALNEQAVAGAVPWRLVISTTTRTGQKLARERFGADRVFWFPLDFAWTVRAWMQALQPKLVVLMESELWPRLLAECARRGVPVAVANARISDRSFKRAMHVRRLWGRVLGTISLFLAQGEESAERLQQLGVAKERIETPGNLKYDIVPVDTPLTVLLRRLLERSGVVVAGSLLPGEEAMLLRRWSAITAQVPGAVLVLAPRHPERFDAVSTLIQESGLPFLRASTLRLPPNDGHATERLKPRTVVLLDTVGDLASVYGLADVAFVGGSLVRKGGHNPLEPARFGVPVLTGPYMDNFREIVKELEAARGIQVVHGEEELGRDLSQLLAHRVEADALGQRGMRVFQRRSGATHRTVAALSRLVQQATPAPGKVDL